MRTIRMHYFETVNNMVVLCGMPTIQYSARSGLLSVYILHSTMPSATCLRLSDVSVICRVTYFQLPVQVCFSSMSVSQAAQRLLGLPNIGHRTLPKIRVGFLYGAHKQGE